MDPITRLNIISLEAWLFGDLSTVIRVSVTMDALKLHIKEKVLREISEENEIDLEQNQLLDMAGA